MKSELETIAYCRSELTQDQVVETSWWFESGHGHQFGFADLALASRVCPRRLLSANSPPRGAATFIAMLAGRQGLSIDAIRSVPYRLAFALGRLTEIAAAIRRSKNDPPLSHTLVRMIGREFVTDHSAAPHQRHVSQSKWSASR
jgi:hypothetical protein